MKKTLWVVLGVVVVILVAGGILTGYLLRSRKNSDQPTATSTSTATTAKAQTTTWTEAGTAISGTFADADAVNLRDVEGGEYRLYYSVEPEVVGNNFEVYSSRSTDGVSWTKEAGTRKTMATFPDVVRTSENKWRMYFQNAGVIKSAISTDGLAFTDESGVRIDKANDLGLTFDNVAAPTVFSQGDGSVKPFYPYVMVYRGTINTPYVGEKVPNNNIQLLLWATSDDGLTWTKRGLAADSRDTTLYGLADGPELFTWKDGSVKLSFWSYTGVYWSTFKDGGFAVPEKVFARTESTAMNKFPAQTAGDPTYALFNNKWYMYFGKHPDIGYALASFK